MEKDYWRLKSRIQWLKAGDKNTKFFHSKTKQRRSYNRILHLIDEDGKEFSTPADIHKHVEKYFNKFYATEVCDFNQSLLQSISITIT